MQLICPLCRSLLEAHGSIDFNAPRLTHPVCPVCGYPEDIPSGFPVPTNWTSLSVLRRNEPIRTYAQLTAQTPTIAITTQQLASGRDAQSNYQDFNVGRGLAESTDYIARSVTSVASQAVGGAVRGAVEGTGTGLVSGLGTPLTLGIVAIAVIGLILFLRK